MKLELVIERLGDALNYPLPGRQGHILMAPEPLDEARFSPHERTDAKKGAVLVLLYPGVNGCAIPFIKRASYMGVHSGQVSFPGGKWDPSDGDLVNTAVRETEEEIGVDRREIKLIGELTPLYIPPSNFSVSPFIGYMDQLPTFKPHPREVQEIIHCDFTQLMDKKIRKKKKTLIQNEKIIQTPYFGIANEIVWGATAMILSELLLLWEINH